MQRTTAAMPTPTMTLPARLDLTAVKPLARDLGDRAGNDLQIDASKVELLGGLCLQLLLAAAQSWAQRGRNLSYGPTSEAFATDLATFGLTAERLEAGVRT